MAEENKQAEAKNGYRAALYVGVWVLFMLGVLTFGEYLVGVIAPPWTVVMLIVAAFKAFYVLTSYMHVGRIFSNDEESH